MCFPFTWVSVALHFHINLTVFFLFYRGVTGWPHLSYDNSLERVTDLHAGVLEQPKFTCWNSKQIPEEQTSCCITPPFNEVSCVVVKVLNSESLFRCLESWACRARGGVGFSCRVWSMDNVCILVLNQNIKHFNSRGCCTHIPQNCWEKHVPVGAQRGQAVSAIPLWWEVKI